MKNHKFFIVNVDIQYLYDIMVKTGVVKYEYDGDFDLDKLKECIKSYSRDFFPEGGSVKINNIIEITNFQHKNLAEETDCFFSKLKVKSAELTQTGIFKTANGFFIGTCFYLQIELDEDKLPIFVRLPYSRLSLSFIKTKEGAEKVMESGDFENVPYSLTA